LIEELIINTEIKTECNILFTDGWGGYERIISDKTDHEIGQTNTQQLERTNGILRQLSGRWHRRQNKFGKIWEQTSLTER